MLPILTGAKLNGYLLFKFSCHSPLYSPEITPLIKQISGDGSVEFFWWLEAFFSLSDLRTTGGGVMLQFGLWMRSVCCSRFCLI